MAEQRQSNQAQAERRQGGRASMDQQVTVTFCESAVQGPGENITADGVYFLADEPLRVLVQIEGQEEAVPGQLVRVANMGDGKTGIAVKFD